MLCLPVGFTIIAAVASINTLLQTLSGEDKRGSGDGIYGNVFHGHEAPVGSMVPGGRLKNGLDCKRLSYYPEFVVLWLRWFSSIIVPWCVDMPAPFILKRGLSRK